VGNGAGSFPLTHLRERDNGVDLRSARQPHQLELQVLSELGLVGFALLMAGFAGLGWAGVRAVRSGRDPAVGLPLALLAALLVQSQLDWTWSVPGVALPALAAGGVVVASAGSTERIRSTSARRLNPFAAGGLAALTLAIMASALLPWWSQEQVASGYSALAAGRPAAAETRAGEARALNPLSIEPLLLRAVASRLRGDRAEQRDALREATRLQPDNPRAWSRLAGALGDVAEGRAAWTRVLALNPYDESARAALERGEA
jgi:cytochrome c-type biogenesis protein CcmH/NrfG